MRSGFLAPLAGTLALAGLSACVAPSRRREDLEDAARARTGHLLGPRSLEGAPALPPGCSFEDGLDPDEAVAIALWRSPALQAELTSLDTALADFDEATRIPNPRLAFLAPIGPRQLTLILTWPIEAIWQVPLRAEAAQRELERVAESLVQIVLDTERDLRLAHADARLARERVDAAAAIASSWHAASRLAASRASAGEIAPIEAASVRAEATIAADAVARARRESEIAEARLLASMGTPGALLPALLPPPTRAIGLPTREELISRALRQRPDLRAAELAIHAAAARGNWERSRVVSLVLGLDGQAPPHETAMNFTVGGVLELPIFSQNQGGIGRADAEVARAGYQYAAKRLSVGMEVAAARAATERARASLRAYESVFEALAESTAGAEHAFAHGEESYLVVVDALRRQADARLRRLDFEADLARAEADLARAVGGTPELESP